jgi:hypothetical protein
MHNFSEPLQRDPLYGYAIDKNGDVVELCGSYEADCNLDRMLDCTNACEGLSNDALDGGWKASELIAYTVKLENALEICKEFLSEDHQNRLIQMKPSFVSSEIDKALGNT